MTDRIDGQVAGLSLLLATLGIIAIASATAYQNDVFTNPFVIRQGIYFVAAMVVFFVLLYVPLQQIFRLHLPFYFITLILGIVVLIPWIGVEAGGGRRWIDFGVATLQVTEVARFLLVVYIAGYLARMHDQIGRSTFTALRLPLWVGLILGLFMLQPDFGSAVLLGMVVAGMLFLAGARFRDLSVLGVVGSVGLVYMLYHRRDRILAFFDTWEHSLDKGYQLTQSLIGFGRGEFVGVGLGNGIQKMLYLPEPHNDFIFSSIVEETGLLGGCLVLALLAWLVYRCFEVARQALEVDHHFAGYISYAVGLLIGLQVLINAGVAMGALPTKGLTLPFISFGGNSLVVCAALVALVCRAQAETHDAKLRCQGGV